MADQFVAEIRLFSFDFAPRSWAFCDGQLLPIQQNTALFSLLGTNFGGNGTNTFALPNLVDRAPRGLGQGPGLSPVSLGDPGGAASQTLTSAEVPAHTHSLLGTTSPAVEHDPTGNLFAAPAAASPGAFATGAAGAAMGTPFAASQAQPHENMQPSLALNFCIALQGIFPPRP